jgi:hypothetical protein
MSGGFGGGREGRQPVTGVWDDRDLTDVLKLPDPFIVEEECLVLLDRAADAAARLRAAERIALRIEEVGRVHFAVALEQVCRAASIVGSRLPHGVHHSAVSADLGSVGVGEDLELSDSLHAGRGTRGVGKGEFSCRSKITLSTGADS